MWWGTSGERLWESNCLGWFDCLGIRERGKVIHGEDLRREFPAPTREQLVAEGTRFVGTARKHGRGGLAAAKSRSGPASSLRSKTASKLSEGVGAVKKAACEGACKDCGP